MPDHQLRVCPTFKHTSDRALRKNSGTIISSDDTSLSPASLTLALKAKAAAKSFKVKITVPALPAGPYFVFVEIDPRGLIVEKDESNNVIASAAPFTVN